MYYIAIEIYEKKNGSYDSFLLLLNWQQSKLYMLLNCTASCNASLSSCNYIDDDDEFNLDLERSDIIASTVQ